MLRGGGRMLTCLWGTTEERLTNPLQVNQLDPRGTSAEVGLKAVVLARIAARFSS